jgi:hypothetical protein
MPEKCGEHGQLLLNVFACAIPVDQGFDREPMAEIMNARSVTSALLPKTDLPRQLPENFIDILMYRA